MKAKHYVKSRTKKPAPSPSEPLTGELKRIWRGSYDLCVRDARLDESRARRFADATIDGIREADRSLQLAN